MILPSLFENLLDEVDGSVARVTLNRPEKHNAFDETLGRELDSVWQALRFDDGRRIEPRLR